MSRVVCLLAVLGFLAVLGAFSLGIQGPAALYPRALLAGALVLVAITAWQELRGADGVRSDPELAALAAGPPGARSAFAAFVLVWLIHPFAMDAFGFILATAVAIVASCLALGFRRVPLVVGSAALFAILFSVLLKTVIYVPMPSAWPDRLVDQAIYRTRGG